eukprot:s643_g3.t1
MLAWLQAEATNSSMTSEQACEGHDGAAYLQRIRKEAENIQESSASLAVPVADCFNIEEGECEGAQPSPNSGTARCKACNQCTGSSTTPCNETIPSAGGSNARFPLGRLACGNDGSTSPLGQCSTSNSITPENFWVFKDANDYLQCQGKDVCKGSWRVKNVGAVCCSGEQTCNNDLVAIFGTDVPSGSDAATCVNDVCCDGLSTCYGSSNDGPDRSGTPPSTQFLDSGTLMCRGSSACYQIWAQISKNLYCSAFSGVGFDGDVCSASGNRFDFLNSDGSSHCVTCLGDSSKIPCASSTYYFDTVNAKVKMICGDGKEACKSAKVVVASSGTCIEIKCVAGSSTCTDLVPTLNGATCHCTGDEDLCETIKDPNGVLNVAPNAVCPYSSDANPCSFTADPCADPTACCDSVGATATVGSSNSPPNCATGCSCVPGPDVTTTGIITGDPHIDTFDGQHYLLLKQGSFSFWRFSGSDAEILSAKNQNLLKKLPVDFKIYAHYSGHTSYTKGLLLVDSSGATSPKRALELTSEDCTWRTKTKDTEWSAVEKPQLLSLPDADGDEMTAFRMTEPLHGQKMYVELLMKKADGAFKKIANLYVRCKPGYHMNMKMGMASKEDIGLVQGQIAAQGHTAAGEAHKASFLQGMRMRSDSEFVVSDEWTDLGGSAAAAAYLSEVDEEGPTVFLKDCTGQEQKEAKAMCKKYLGEPPTRSEDPQSFEHNFDSCVFDVCNGGGEVAAQLAAEIFRAQ